MKNEIKKLLLVTLVLLLVFSFSACKSKGSEASKSNDIICVDYVCFDWVMGLLGDNPCDISVGVINSGGVDMHSFQPSANDIALISKAPMVIYIGGESEKWVEDIFSEGASYGYSSNHIVLNMMDRFMASSCFKDYDDNDDEHIWASPKIVSELVTVLSDAISATLIEPLGEDKAAVFRESSDAYIAQLNGLTERCSGITAEKPVVLADRNPFYYLFEDCGIDCCAAFDGCSAETEASFETIIELAAVCDDNKLEKVLVIDTHTDEVPDLAKSVIDASDVLSTNDISETVIRLTSFDAALSPDDSGSSFSYIDEMSKNIDLIEEACGEK